MRKIFLTLSLVLFLLTPITLSAYHDTIRPDGSFDYETFVKEGMAHILNKHIDGEKTDKKEVAEQAIKGMLKAFDQHSAYFTEKEFKEYNQRSTGKYFGIGAMVSYKDGFVVLEQVFEGSPSERSGLKHGDKIMLIEKIKTSDISLQDAVGLLKGDLDTKVAVKVIRKSGEIEDVTIIRGKITTPILTNLVLDNNIAYIKLVRFGPNSASRFNKGLQSTIDKIGKNNLKGIIVDFRSNPGGRLDQAIKIADLFVNKGLIVETRGRNGTHTSAHANEPMIIPIETPLVILQNEFSASGSEVVTGALKDLNRATVIGIKSYGKGSVQSIMRLPHGGALKLTIAKYYTASGKVIHGVGIVPDIKFSQSLPKDNKDKIKRETFIMPENKLIDPTMQRAIDFINK